MADPKAWLEKIKRGEILPENDLKRLCEKVFNKGIKEKRRGRRGDKENLKRRRKKLEFKSKKDHPNFFLKKFLKVKEILIEESNVQPVNSPVTVRFILSFLFIFKPWEAS